MRVPGAAKTPKCHAMTDVPSHARASCPYVPSNLVTSPSAVCCPARDARGGCPQRTPLTGTCGAGLSNNCVAVCVSMEPWSMRATATSSVCASDVVRGERDRAGLRPSDDLTAALLADELTDGLLVADRQVAQQRRCLVLHGGRRLLGEGDERLDGAAVDNLVLVVAEGRGQSRAISCGSGRMDRNKRASIALVREKCQWSK